MTWGVTLIELLLCLALLAIILCFSLPFTSTMYQENKAQAIQYDILSAIRFAKTLALTSSKSITLRPLSDSVDWSEGIQILEAIDISSLEFPRLDRGTEESGVRVRSMGHAVKPREFVSDDYKDAKPLHEWRWQSPDIHVSWHGFQSNQYLLFSADASRNATNGFFLIKTKAQHATKIVINRLGRVRIE